MSTRTTINLAGMLGALAALNGCAMDRSFSPPAENQYVTVAVKVSSDLKARPMKVMYRSAVCTEPSYDGNFNRTDLEGHYVVELQPQRRAETDVYEARLAIDGGGACQWRLSNATFGVFYSKPEFSGEQVTFGSGGGVVVVFDHNNSQRGTRGIEVSGDLELLQDYYPWIDEEFLGAYRKSIKLVGGVSLFLEYYAPDARYVYFEPVFHRDYLLRSKGPSVKKPGNYTAFTYPDGSFFDDGNFHPDFEHLQDIRRATEAKK